MFEYFYHQILRKTVISFGTLFNNILIKHENSAGGTVSVLKVPLAYGPTQKFLARLEQSPNLNKPIQMTLPRMAFEFTSLSYDPTRKATSTQFFLAKSPGDPTAVKKSYLPVPYNMGFELSIMADKNDDVLQIIEQILPYFQPSYNLTVNLISEIGEKRDIPVVLDNINMRDDYEGDFNSRRTLIYTLTFTAKTYLFGPVSTGAGVIKKATIDYMTGVTADVARREMRYSVSPTAVKDYDSSVATALAAQIDLDATVIPVLNASSISTGSRIYIDEELIYVKSKEGNNLFVTRAYENTTATEHAKDISVYLVTETDDTLIQVGDDFGFSETSSFFQDFKVYSSSQNADIDVK